MRKQEHDLAALLRSAAAAVESSSDSREEAETCIAKMFLMGIDHDPRGLGNAHLSNILSSYAGQKVFALLDDLLALHRTLVDGQYTEDEPFDFGYCDRYAFPAVDTAELRGFEMLTQNLQYLVLLERRYGHWSIHIRRIWKSFDYEHRVRQRATCLAIEEYLEAQKPPPAQEIIDMAEELMEYSDDAPAPEKQAWNISRPSLATYRRHGFQPGVPEAPGIRFRDLRDRGYIFSVANEAIADDPPRIRGQEVLASWHDLRYCLTDLASAVDTLVHKIDD